MILNRQQAVRVARRPLELFLRRVRRALGLGRAELTVCLVSDAEIARMNEMFRRKKGPTDVLSFPAVEGSRKSPLTRARRMRTNGTGSAARSRAKAESARYLGDVAISPATARRNAKRFGRALPNELRVLILHGTLHLLGYDHETDSGQMDRLEQRLRQRFRLA